MATAESTWDAARRLLVTRLQGTVGTDDVRRWIDGLHRELDRIADDTRFNIIVDLHGYEPGDLGAHKEMRTVVPLTLTRYGFRTAFFDLFDPVDVPLERTRGITCVAAAHVHHDADKMDEYNHRIGRPNERFFTDYRAAEAWIEALG